MKKRTKKLGLAKETVANLHNEQLVGPHGGSVYGSLVTDCSFICQSSGGGFCAFVCEGSKG